MTASQEEVTLLDDAGSTFVCRVQIALHLKGVAYTYLEQQNMGNKYSAPMLFHNGKNISESLAIVEYIDETWKNNPILPSHPYQRALARFWAKFIDDKVVDAAWNAVFTVDEQEREKNLKESNEALKFLENEIKDKKFFGGEEFGLVDIAAVYIAFWIPIFQEIGGLELFTNENFPRLYKWSQEL